jgi:hypothetical protein
MKDEQKYQSPKPGKGDAAHAVARAGLSAIPMFGGAAIELLEFIPIKPLVARALTALESYATHSRLP